MLRTDTLPAWLIRAAAAAAVFLLTAPAALAGSAGGREIEAATDLDEFLATVAGFLTGTVGTSIGIIAFAAAGIYIMYARQTGQAVGAIAKVFVGLLILFGGAALITAIGPSAGAAAF